MLLAACTKPSLAPAPAPEQYDRYIFFSHSVETKATLVENAGDIGTFGVVGFKYDFYAKDEDGNYVKDADGNLVENTWDEYKNTTPDPNVFYDEVINSEGTSTYDITPVETVRVTAGAQGTNDTVGTASYEPLQGWSNSKKYAFFAFYPMSNGSNVKLVNLSGEDYTGGVPAVKYTMDFTNGATLKTSMVDLMTAPHKKDLFWHGSGEKQNNIAAGEISFDFHHHLSALGVNVKYSTSGSILLDGITLRLSGIKYNTLVVPLDGDTATRTGSSLDIDLPFTLQETEKVLEGSGEKKLIDKLMFIPQTELMIQVLISYRRVLSGYNESKVENFSILSQQLELKEGYKHMINLNFTEQMVNATVNSARWVSKDPVYDTFN